MNIILKQHVSRQDITRCYCWRTRQVRTCKAGKCRVHCVKSTYTLRMALSVLTVLPVPVNRHHFIKINFDILIFTNTKWKWSNDEAAASERKKKKKTCEVICAFLAFFDLYDSYDEKWIFLSDVTLNHTSPPQLRSEHLVHIIFHLT